MAARQFDDVRAIGRMRLVYFRHFPFFLSSFPFSVESARTVGDMFRPPPARKSHITSGESSSWSASDLIRSVPVAFRNRRKILFDFLACSLNRRSVRQCHFHAVSLSRLAVCYLYCSFGQSQVIFSYIFGLVDCTDGQARTSDSGVVGDGGAIHADVVLKV